MDALTARFLEAQNEEDRFDAEIDFSDSEAIPETFSKLLPSKVATVQRKGVSSNRQAFLDTAACIMKLISYDNVSDADVYNPNHNTPMPAASSSSQLVVPGDAESMQGHAKKGSIVEELLEFDLQQLASVSLDDREDLAKQAVFEFEALVRQNDALYAEKAQLQIQQEKHYSLIQQLQTENAALQRYQQQQQQQQQNQPSTDEDDVYTHSSVEDIDEHEMIEQLQSEIVVLKQQMSQIQEDEQTSVQKLLDLSELGESVTAKLKEQLNDNNSTDEEEKTEDDDEETANLSSHEVIDVDSLSTQLQHTQSKLEESKQQNGDLLLHVEEMESMLENAHNEKEELSTQLEHLHTSIHQQSIQDDIATLQSQKQNLKRMVDGIKEEYETHKAEQSAELQNKDRKIEELECKLLECATSEAQRKFNDDMIESLKHNVSRLEQELAHKREALKKEKEEHFAILEQYTNLKDEMNDVSHDLKHARLSSVDIEYRSGSRIEQLESNVIQLNEQLKHEQETSGMSKRAIETLRTENQELEDELGRLAEELEAVQQDTSTYTAAVHSKIHSMQRISLQIDQLRLVVAAQHAEIDKLKQGNVFSQFIW